MAAMTPSPLAGVRRRGVRGNSLVEFALVLPVLLLVFAGIVDFGFVFQRYEVLTNAVREGARVAVLPMNASLDAAGNYSFNRAVIDNRVREYIRVGLGMAAGDYTGIGAITVTPETVVVGADRYTVVTVRTSVTYTYIVIGHVATLLRAGGPQWGTIPLAAQATMRIEGQ